jgi:hypothetical protein
MKFAIPNWESSFGMKFCWNHGFTAVVIAIKGNQNEKRSESCDPQIGEVSRLRFDGNPDIGFGNRGECGCIQRAQRAGTAAS